jgi:hypothetical protein
MGRTKGSGKLGVTRSTRLPAAIDAWLEERIARDPNRSVSDVLIELVHGGLRLREGYMAIHRRALEAKRDDEEAFATYRACLLDTFGLEYVEHLDRWLEADGIKTSSKETIQTNGAAVLRA